MLDLARLSLEQRQAVLAPNGPLAIVAGPGSGKTTVLAARIAYLVIARHVPPDSILAVSFTTKAARQLRNRLVGVLGPLGRDVDVTTFHAFGLRIIRHWVEELGLGPGPPIVYDEDDARTLLQDVAQGRDVDLKTLPITTLGSRLNRYRLGDETTPQWLRALADEYEAALQRRGAVDFTAMLSTPLHLFDERPGALRLYQQTYSHILVDEFQDVSAPQYRLLQQLAARHGNLTVVGDPLQTLYAWRGADPDGLRHFQRDFPAARVFQLHHNYRSTRSILAVANALGASLDADRHLRTDNPAGAIPRLHSAKDEDGEAVFVAEEIGRLLGNGHGHCPSDIAVVYRTNHQADELGLALRERSLAYRVRGRSDLFHHREVRDALAYLRLACNPGDTAALEHIVKAPTPVLHVLPDIHRQASHLRPPLLLDTILERTGYRQWLAEQPGGERRLGHLADLRRLLERVTGDLADWLEALRLGDDPDANETGEQVTLTTIHGSKGGEWRVVFVVGMEEGLLPHTHALMREPESGAIQEEHRLAYVAVTRPRDHLYLSYCRNRRHNGESRPRCPSRFLNGLPLDRRR